MIERQTHLANRLSKSSKQQKTSRHTENVTNSVSRRKQSVDDKQRRSASHRRQKATKKRREDVEKLSETRPKLLRKSHVGNTSPRPGKKWSLIGPKSRNHATRSRGVF